MDMDPDDRLDAGLARLATLIHDPVERAAIRGALLELPARSACRYFTEVDVETALLLRATFIAEAGVPTCQHQACSVHLASDRTTGWWSFLHSHQAV